ncbi:MAG: CBS domain-containing protein [Nitrospirae bacterium]|nr:CBS domain-containing protein [Nitrospirota bacterium]MDA8213903.1 CBS domain-containing protein [Nitrospiraceae bacterium]
MKGISLRKIFTSKVISVSPETPVSEAVSLMERNRISCLVVARHNKPVGIFTERDFVMAVHRQNHLDSLEIKELMSRQLIKANIDTNIYEAYSLLETNRIRHLVIIDSDGDLAGVITQSDIMKNLGVEYFVEVKNISKIMTKTVVTAGKEFMLRDAISRMAEYSISCIVVEKDRYPVGILTERDVVRLFRGGIDIENLMVGEVMAHPVRTIPSNVPVHEAARIMNKEKIRRLVVVDKEGRIAGLITQSDIIKRIEERYIEFLKEIIRGKEEALQETRKMLSEKVVLENILRSSTDMAIVAIDRDFRIVYYNPVAEKIFGYKADKVIGRTVMDVHTGKNVDPLLFEKAVETIEKDGSYKYTFEYKKEGGIRFIESTVSGILDSNNNLAGFVLMARDITEHKKLGEELLKAQKLESIGVLAGGIAHDFNNLLTGILNCISLSKSLVKPEDKVFESLTMAEKASRLAKDLTQQLFTFAKIGEPVRKTTSITEIIKDAAGLMPTDFNATCEISIPDDLWPVEVDKGQMNRVFHNLVINAKEAMPKGGIIKIRAENINTTQKDSLPLKEGRYIKVSIEDQGQGISRKDLQKVFDPYFTTKQRGNRKGTGLGLAICYSIIKNHDGHITVSSEEGAGATFYIYLPASTRLFRQ